MVIYTVIPRNTSTYHEQDFEDLEEAILWQDELAMMGIASDIERTESFFAA